MLLVLIKDDIFMGWLVMFFDYVFDDMVYYIVYTFGVLDQLKVCVFRDWLLSEAAA